MAASSSAGGTTTARQGSAPRSASASFSTSPASNTDEGGHHRGVSRRPSAKARSATRVACSRSRSLVFVMPQLAPQVPISPLRAPAGCP
ncbi:MAG: hypothetical protein IPF99_13995 [Deltaproteobacteria bacterium]|nr:hypothetical protein [Deltaproteobacteria bacterium]